MSVIPTFVPFYRKHYVNIDNYSSMQAQFKTNNHVNVSNSPSVSISFLIGGLNNDYLPSILKTHFQEKSLVPADSSPVILVMLELR